MPPYATPMVEPFQMPSATVPVVSMRKAFPAVPTENRENGLVVPMPTLPPRKVAAGPAPDCVTASVGCAEEEEAKIPACAQSAVVVAEVFTV